MTSLNASLRMLVALLAVTASAHATPFTFSTGAPDGLIATTSRPAGSGIETETADDFATTAVTSINHATFTGLITGNATLASIFSVGVEIYRVFPDDSALPPSANVPTRLNSPSDVAFDDRSSTDGTLAYSLTLLNPSFTANNSVLNGINPVPNQATTGEGAVTGLEVLFDVTFTTPFVLPADHYFFVPQVGVSGGDFLWLSAPKPTGDNNLTPDLQTWVRNESLSPDWLRVGTDIVDGATPHQFNASFSLDGQVVPEPSSLWLLLSGLCIAALFARFRLIPHAGS